MADETQELPVIDKPKEQMLIVPIKPVLVNIAHKKKSAKLGVYCIHNNCIDFAVFNLVFITADDMVMAEANFTLENEVYAEWENNSEFLLAKITEAMPSIKRA